MNLVALIGLTVALQAQASGPSSKPQLQEITLAVQGMTCNACAVKVKSSLDKKSSIHDVSLRFEPSIARFKIDPAHESIQDLIKTVRGAGSQYDARLMLRSEFDDDKLSEALRKVEGVRSAGMKDSRGIRLVTFLMDKKTYYSDLAKAAESVGATLSSPTFENKKPGA